MQGYGEEFERDLYVVYCYEGKNKVRNEQGENTNGRNQKNKNIEIDRAA
jgi:hypothetical protein